MGLFDNGFKNNIISGLAFGIGAAVIAPVVIPVLSAGVKPMAKVAIKEGIQLYEKGRELMAEARETMEDLVAEARSEIEVTQSSEKE